MPTWVSCRRSILTALALAAGVVGLSAAYAAPAAPALLAPEPDPVPRRWQLDVKVGPLRLAQFKQADGSIQRYFYLTYRVTNKTGEDLLFAPSFELATDQGEVIRSGRGVPLDVSRDIMTMLDNPWLEDQISILGVLLQGDQNARDGLVIFKAGDLDITHLDIFASGFSGEVQTDAYTDPDTGKRVVVPLYKTLRVRYFTPGDVTARGPEPIDAFESTWVMR
ncbi:MAG: hypothetical protein HRU70_01090 [Phycisphaeraceae bacterium]|nr:MAG: hypothetical protein HRU70_01090 [Phycisphaeraceae bacterium]